MLGKRGFTLVELMVTIVIIAIIAAMAVPSMSSLVAKQRLNTTTKELVSLLATARSQAVLFRQEVKVNLSGDGDNSQTQLYWKPAIDNTLTATPTPTPTPTSIVFRADGTVKNIASATNFIVCNSKIQKTKTIILATTGTTSIGVEGNCS